VLQRLVAQLLQTVLLLLVLQRLVVQLLQTVPLLPVLQRLVVLQVATAQLLQTVPLRLEHTVQLVQIVVRVRPAVVPLRLAAVQLPVLVGQPLAVSLSGFMFPKPLAMLVNAVLL
jgi:hypothetical protein